jgi:nucleoside-diphosphate-sugar epimerase
MSRLLCIGMGYSAEAVARLLAPQGWAVAGTSRTAEGIAGLQAKSWAGHIFDGVSVGPDLAAALAASTHLLVSVAPGPTGDPVLNACRKLIAAAADLAWIGYLSTVGVYGDTGGAWVDEDTPPLPRQERTIRRVAAEQAWLRMGAPGGTIVQVFRLSGIYGPGRNPLVNLLDGSAQRIVKPGQVFNRIHVNDIAQSVIAGIERGQPDRIYNLTDDEPAPPDEVVAYAAGLLGMTPPPPIPFVQARLSPMAASFYADNRRVRNDRMRKELGVNLLYPTYREGLAALATELRQSGAATTQGAV